MARKRTKTPPACSFCGDTEKDGPKLLYSHPMKGPWICASCVWIGVEVLNEEIDEHSCVVYVSTSKLHERGVFAGQYIRKGTYVGTYQGKDNGPISYRNARYAMYHYDRVTEEETGWRVGSNEFRFLNHADDPNLEMDDEYHFWATRTIKRDEELTWYYGPEYSEMLKKRKRRKKRKR